MRFRYYTPLLVVLPLLPGCLSIVPAEAQPRVIAGPMVGHVTENTANLWLLVKDGQRFSCVHRTVSRSEGAFELYRIPDVNVDTFSFLVGSCAFLNTERPVENITLGPRRTRIYRYMSATPASFMLWLGDFLYYRDREWETYEGMWERNFRQRMNPEVNAFLRSMPQYAMYDDHDYGPNNADSRFEGKDRALEVFRQFWANPYYGTKKYPGCYTHFKWADCEFFLTDGRRYCNKADGSAMLGPEQMGWLKKGLLQSKATFKFVAMGVQVLTTDQMSESYSHYAAEYEELMSFLEQERIEGVIFLSGDRHFAELSRLERPGAYPLYDFTTSGITSPAIPVQYAKNENRVAGTYYNRFNYGRIRLTGRGEDRAATLEIYNQRGRLVWSHTIKAAELR